MKLLDIPKRARPVLFENDDREFPYSVGGTAFIVKFSGRAFVITARHVLNLKSFEPRRFCIQYRPDCRDFLPLRALYLVRGADAADTDQYDIAVREIDSAAVKIELYGLVPTLQPTCYGLSNNLQRKGRLHLSWVS
jgi:hypothetical protein